MLLFKASLSDKTLSCPFLPFFFVPVSLYNEEHQFCMESNDL